MLNYLPQEGNEKQVCLTIMTRWSESNASHNNLEAPVFDVYFVQFGTILTANL